MKILVLENVIRCTNLFGERRGGCRRTRDETCV